MSYEIKLYKDAFKTLQKLDKTMRIRILDQLKLISKNPRNPELDIKKMQGLDNQYRLRVESYRIIYSIFEDRQIIVIIKIGPQGDIYKKPRAKAHSFRVG